MSDLFVVFRLLSKEKLSKDMHDEILALVPFAEVVSERAEHTIIN